MAAQDSTRTFTGQWCVSNATNQYGAGRDTYRWRPAIVTAGTYDVYVWWSTRVTRSTNLPISVKHSAATAVKNFNQQINGGKWLLHGRYSFRAGSDGYVEVDDVNGQAAADAVRLVCVP